MVKTGCVQSRLLGSSGSVVPKFQVRSAASKPVRITDLARLMVRLVGKSEDEIGIVFTGLRPGEKLYEELLADSETTLPTPHPKLRVARSREVDVAGLMVTLEWMRTHRKAGNQAVRDQLHKCIPEYKPAP